MHFDQLRRRNFITLIGSAAAAWPLAARAQQQGDRMRRIGVLMTTAEDDVESKARIAAFVQACSGGTRDWWRFGRRE
jgi:putative tryptophan/tyrosine transport system substrate-binding protein